MIKAETIGKTIRYGNQEYKYYNRQWYILAFGFYIESPNAKAPSYKYQLISEDLVPKDVKRELS